MIKKTKRETDTNKNCHNLINEFKIMRILDYPKVFKAVDIAYDDKKFFKKSSTDFNHVIRNVQPFR